MTLATLAGSLHAYLDRVLVSALVPIAVFAYYATPQEAIWRFIVLPVAFSGVLYPLFSAEWVGPRTRVSATYAGAVFAVIVSLGTVALWGANFSAEIMTAWLGPEVGSHTRTVTQWFLAGILLNGLATIPFAFLQAVGRARTTGLIQAAQLIPYVVALYVITRRFGIEGAAMVWTARMAIDAALLFTAARRTMHEHGLETVRVLTMLLPVVAGFVAGGVAESPMVRGALTLTACVATAALGWRVLQPPARAELRAMVGSVWRPRVAQPHAGGS
jgi:O-antigen/teichoic acid export membrane protein